MESSLASLDKVGTGKEKIRDTDKTLVIFKQTWRECLWTQQRAVILLKKLNGLVHIIECVMSFIIFHVRHRHRHHHHQFRSLLSIALVKWQGGHVGITETDSTRERWCKTYNKRAKLSEDTKTMFNVRGGKPGYDDRELMKRQ